MNSAITKLGGALAACVAKVGVGTLLANPVTLIACVTALAGAAIYDTVKES